MTTHHIEEIIPAISHVLALKQGKIIENDIKERIITEGTIRSIFDIELSLIERNGRYWLH